MSDEELAFTERFRRWGLDHPRQWHVETDTTGIINFLSTQTEKIVMAQIEGANEIVASQERIADGIDRVAISVDRVAEGLESLEALFEWGFSELVWHLEEQRKVLQDILSVLQAPLDTQARELKKRAEYAYRNGWFEDALEDFIESEKKNRYDFTIHQNLGNIYLFEKSNPSKALEYYEKAAKYATPRSPYHTSIAFLHIGLVKYLQGDFKEACNATSQALRLSPHLYEAHYQHAQYCANLRKYSDSIEHLKVAIEGDRYYCVKADSERDFNTMKKQLTTLFEELRQKARVQTETGIKRARTLIRKCKAYGIPPQALRVAKGKQSKAAALFKRDSYFDYLDAHQKADEASASILDSSRKYLSSQFSDVRGEYEKEVQRCGKLAEKNAQRISDVAMFSFVIFPFVPVVFYALSMVLTKNDWGSVSVGFMTWLFGLFLYISTGLTGFMRRFLYRRYIWEESYESELALLRKHLTYVQRDSGNQP